MLPDYEEGWGYYRQAKSGAPVDAEAIRCSTTSQKLRGRLENDGQRWRWCLEQAAESNRDLPIEVRLSSPSFLTSQFGVQTMAFSGWRFGRMETDDTKDAQSGTYALNTLGEDETIARLATGIKRFKLPDEFNFIKISQQVGDAARHQASMRFVRLAEDLREPAAISQSGRLLAAAAEGVSEATSSSECLAAAARSDRGQLGPFRADR